MKRVTARQRASITERANGYCEYCMSSSDYSTQTFSVEHIYPIHLGGQSELDNLALSCQGCNSHKATRVEWPDPLSGEVAPLFHPRQMKWEEHFTWEAEYTRIVGITPTGRATIEALQMNRQGLQNLRGALYVFGQHPPSYSKGEI